MLREIGELLPFASYLLDGCLGVTNRGSPPDVFLYKALWEYAANLQENTIAKVWLHSILHGFFTINLVHVFRTHQFNHFLFYNNTSGRLLLCWKKPKLTHAIQLPVDTGRKLNVHKTFRRRPGRLLNVLCTFNLRPASTGFWKNLAQKATLKTKFNVNFRWILDINWKLSFEQISESCFKQINLLTETNP